MQEKKRSRSGMPNMRCRDCVSLAKDSALCFPGHGLCVSLAMDSAPCFPGHVFPWLRSLPHVSLAMCIPGCVLSPPISLAVCFPGCVPCPISLAIDSAWAVCNKLTNLPSLHLNYKSV